VVVGNDVFDYKPLGVVEERNLTWTMHNRRITYNMNINRNRWRHIRRRRTLQVKRKLTEGENSLKVTPANTKEW